MRPTRPSPCSSLSTRSNGEKVTRAKCAAQNPALEIAAMLKEVGLSSPSLGRSRRYRLGLIPKASWNVSGFQGPLDPLNTDRCHNWFVLSDNENRTGRDWRSLFVAITADTPESLGFIANVRNAEMLLMI